MIFSVSVSMLAVASSNINICGLCTTVRAKLNNCLCPLEKSLPPSLTSVSKPNSCLLINESALTYSQAFLIASSLISSSLKLIFDLIVPEN